MISSPAATALTRAVAAFFSIGNFVPYTTKTLREDAHSRELKFVACATALGARVSQAKLFVSACCKTMRIGIRTIHCDKVLKS